MLSILRVGSHGLDFHISSQYLEANTGINGSTTRTTEPAATTTEPAAATTAVSDDEDASSGPIDAWVDKGICYTGSSSSGCGSSSSCHGGSKTYSKNDGDSSEREWEGKDCNSEWYLKDDANDTDTEYQYQYQYSDKLKENRQQGQNFIENNNEISDDPYDHYLLKLSIDDSRRRYIHSCDIEILAYVLCARPQLIFAQIGLTRQIIDSICVENFEEVINGHL